MGSELSLFAFCPPGPGGPLRACSSLGCISTSPHGLLCWVSGQREEFMTAIPRVRGCVLWVMVVQLCAHTENPCAVHLKWVDCTGCELHLQKSYYWGKKGGFVD